MTLRCMFCSAPAAYRMVVIVTEVTMDCELTRNNYGVCCACVPHVERVAQALVPEMYESSAAKKGAGIA